ncbi:Elongation of fatty acids protein 2 [Zancudomyces culisetae]|uniref:Elongation of fatty acids protein n=1 Tax=Zancudomyces culisetae TaxID=1213189 RepID=A0A1R1PNB1_ZANCU|nr:Elongation of fatty acids protein 2 [Zancudomyces culisetae]|eukprot:OMH82456.1 Elongation of fatty acids protein 2 [Zancudomyces culisetae]
MEQNILSPDFWLKRFTGLFGYNPSEFAYVSGKTFLSTNREVFAGCVLYLSIIFGGKYVMRNQKAFELKAFSQLHNIFLSIISGLLLILFAEQLVPMLYTNGLFYAICDENAWNKPLEFLYYVNYLIKWFEFVDTFLLVLKKKKTPFLHVYHHSATMFLCYTQLEGTPSVSWLPITINLFVHVIMYYYYYLTGKGIKVWWKKMVTVIQIAQFVIDLTFVYFCSSILLFSYLGYENRPYKYCRGSKDAAIAGCLILSSYLLLFVKFFFDTYKKIKSPDASTKKKASPQSQKQ